MDELFELLVEGLPFEWLLWPFGGAVPHGGGFDASPSVTQLQKEIARENARRKVPQLAGLEHDRRAGLVSLLDFRRRYARLAGREPAEDPARTGGPYGPNSVAVAAFLDRVRAMTDADWDLAGEHLAYLQGNVVVRRAVLSRYRTALAAAISAARLTAAAAAAEALRTAVPEPRREVWQLNLAWLPAVLVTDPRAASGSIAAAPAD